MGCTNLKLIIFFVHCLKFSACIEDAYNKPPQFLDDMIKDFRNETWDISETACKEKTLSLLENVQNYTLWATWVWDSMNTKPIGSLYGSQYQLGNYDQCLTSPMTPMNPGLRTQYCLANIKIEGKLLNVGKSAKHQNVDLYEKADNYIHTQTTFGQDLRIITWGVCVPASCNSQSVQRFVSKLVKYSDFSSTMLSINIESCEEAVKILQYTIGDYLFLLMTTAAIFIFSLKTPAVNIGSGPLWSQILESEGKTCKKNWWLSLLMINNYIDRENMCYPVIWSTYCDFHFSIVGITLVFFYSKNRGIGVFLFQVILFLSLIVPGIYTGLNQFPPLFMLSIEALKEIRNDSVFKDMYIASHNRLAAYLVGMMCGYVMYLYKPNHFKKSISRCWSIVGTSVALGLMIGVIELGKSYYSRNYSRVEAVLYASLNRPVWAFAVGLIVVCCIYGSLPSVKGYLGWSVFRPPSRLTYGVYMIHAVVLTVYMYSARSPQHMTISSMVI